MMNLHGQLQMPSNIVSRVSNNILQGVLFNKVMDKENGAAFSLTSELFSLLHIT